MDYSGHENEAAIDMDEGEEDTRAGKLAPFGAVLGYAPFNVSHRCSRLFPSVCLFISPEMPF